MSAATTAEDSVGLCSTADGDGCGGLFPSKTAAGLCGKCKRLSGVALDSDDYKTYSAYKQCSGCGGAWRNMPHDQCGPCRSKMPPPPPPGGNNAGPPPPPPTQEQQDQRAKAIEASRAARAHAMDCRTNKQPSQAPQTTPNVTNSTSASEGLVYLIFEARIRTKESQKPGKGPKIEGDMGKWGKTYPKSKYMSEILEDTVKTNVNEHWEKREGMSLLTDEATLRWKGNLNLPPGSMSRTLGELVLETVEGTNEALYRPTTTTESKKLASGGRPLLQLPLEVYIDRITFDERRRASVAAMRTTASRKRSGTESHHHDTTRAKRQASGNSGHSSTLPLENVRFEVAHIKMSEDTGDVEIAWPEDADTDTGKLSPQRLNQGGTKYVHNLEVGGDLLVAKRFYNIGGGVSPTGDENAEMLELDLLRLENLRWYLRRFFARLNQDGIEHDSNIVVADAFLIREVGPPSEASGLELGDEAHWLVENRRSQTVRKFCGTLQQGLPPKDKTGITIGGLIHFMFDEMETDSVFADIQGSKATIDGVETLVLFDPMSHTIDGESGVGDHGQVGIDAFVAQHKCNYVCLGLGLKPVKSSSGESDGSEEEDD